MKSATVSMMPMTMKKFAVEERGQADGETREDARKHGERGIGAGGHGAADEVHQQEAVDGLRQGRAGEGNHDEGSGLAVRVALLPRADARLRREARAERAAHGGQTQRTRHTNKFNAHNTFLLFLIIF